ncbi:universal stress protein [Pleionea sediminis]|uniref:universal stress protein n=1 Tax=Pleionea sediminis TaxID=2569479 RepID=UPI001184F24F|nr:universal stress protein [Pleionea sediminis]
MKEQKQYILSCIDGSKYSEAVCDYSSWIANKVDAPLTFLHTIEHTKVPAVADLTGAIGLGASEDLLNELTEVEQNRSRLLIEKGNIMLKAAKKKAVESGVSHVEIRQRHGALAESLVELEDEIRVLVVGIRGEQHEGDESGVGTQLETTIRSLHKPILVVNKSFSTPQKIMLAYNGSSASRKALSMVGTSPAFKDAICHLVYVGDADQSIDTLLDEAKKELENSDIEVTTVKLEGEIDEALAKYQLEQDIDLTVMGAFSHSRVRGFLLGSFTEKMLEKTKRPLLLLR